MTRHACPRPERPVLRRLISTGNRDADEHNAEVAIESYLWEMDAFGAEGCDW